MKNTRHPSFILAIVSLLTLFVSIGLKSNGYGISNYVFIAAVVMGAIHWIWTIIDVSSRSDMKPFQKRFWLIAVIAAPAIGGMLFYVLHQRKDRLTT